jgi:hypothetical protein
MLPWTEFRCCPSSLYTFPARGLARDRHLTGFPEFEQFYVPDFPERTQSYGSSPLRLPVPPRPPKPRRAIVGKVGGVEGFAWPRATPSIVSSGDLAAIFEKHWIEAFFGGARHGIQHHRRGSSAAKKRDAGTIRRFASRTPALFRFRPDRQRQRDLGKILTS